MTKLVLEYSRTKYAGVKPTHWKSGDVDVTNYNPLFLNDAMYDQKPVQSYGNKTFQKLKEIQQERDPKGLFSKRTGGFKYT